MPRAEMDDWDDQHVDSPGFDDFLTAVTNTNRYLIRGGGSISGVCVGSMSTKHHMKFGYVLVFGGNVDLISQ